MVKLRQVLSNFEFAAAGRGGEPQMHFGWCLEI
jgi:hypothetical protein